MKVPKQIDGHYTLQPSNEVRRGHIWLILALFVGLFIAAFIEYRTDPNADKPYRAEQPNVIDPGASAWAR